MSDRKTALEIVWQFCTVYVVLQALCLTIVVERDLSLPVLTYGHEL